ncbi:MAG: 1-deoxy-D-xylulose-5-phosphate synthase [Spirochaetes bacterium]|nr:1-deoxy-D-xylulose-5-phosphate synthase [Spirochaetota bacterium]
MEDRGQGPQDKVVLLESIRTVTDLRKMDAAELPLLAEELRDYIVDVVSANGGHLASSLGVVELTIALHRVFKTPADKIIWDVGHQSYAHKILTGRRDEFRTLRKFKGLSGFPKRNESPFDAFNTGHSSTSLSLALGEAVGRDLKGEKYKVIAVIGDGSLTGGMAFEALNQIGHLQNDLIIILNDNEHSISKNVGALPAYLMRMITGSLYNRMRKSSYDIIRKIPRYGNRIYDFLYKMEASLKGILVPGHLFEDMGLRYFGPVDGHDIALLSDILTRLKEINSGPKILHVITRKGKGYRPAENDPAVFHGIGPFNRENGLPLEGYRLSYSELIGRTLADISKKDKKVIAITAAMKLGTGLYEFEKKSPGRFFDVGIAEQHAITFAAALASKGFRPFVSVYSTFLQRAIDQVIHDVAIMNLPVRILVDRAGIVGSDGETHHGVFDIALLKSVPNLMLLAPSDGAELRDMIHFAAGYDKGPLAIRYPRGSVKDANVLSGARREFKPGKISVLKKGRDIALFAVGDMMGIVRELAGMLESRGAGVTVVNLITVKPLDIEGIEREISRTRHFITLENGCVAGGAGEHLVSSIRPALKSRCLFNAGFPDRFIAQGSVSELMRLHGLDAESLCARILPSLKSLKKNEEGKKARRLPRRK